MDKGLFVNDRAKASVSGASGYFALRSVRNRRFVQVAPASDDEAWVVRARGEGEAASGGVRVGALSLWHEDGDGSLRNVGTGALLNDYRGHAHRSVIFCVLGGLFGGARAGGAESCGTLVLLTTHTARFLPLPWPMPWDESVFCG